MLLHDEIAALRVRIAKRETERDAMRASGRQEKYLAAFCVVESLELQLEQLRQQGLGTSMKNHARYPASAPGANQAVIAKADAAGAVRRAGGRILR